MPNNARISVLLAVLFTKQPAHSYCTSSIFPVGMVTVMSKVQPQPVKLVVGSVHFSSDRSKPKDPASAISAWYVAFAFPSSFCAGKVI